MSQIYQQYVADLKQSLDRLPWQTVAAIADVLERARLEQRQIFILGNGGSAATASHMACDWAKNTALPGRARLRVMALTDNAALLSALANDLGYEGVFAEQLINLVRPGDVVIAISTSGNSPNVLKAIQVARASGAFTIGWTGGHGGQMAGMVDIALVVDSHCVEQIEDIHLIVEHMLTNALRQAIAEELAPQADALRQAVAEESSNHARGVP